jgi:signal transduction histidine kinase
MVAVPVDNDMPSCDVVELVIAETAGAVAASVGESTIPVSATVIGQAFADRTPRRIDDLDVGLGAFERPGPALVLPLRTTNTVAGVLVTLRPAGAQRFSAEQLDMMAAFADQAALAWQLATAQRRMRELDVLTDRDRIARDLHDHVIQRLFAVGLSLQGTIPRARSTELQQRLSDCVDDLQGVIQEIRTAIFDLHGASAGATRLRQRLDEAIAQFSGTDLHTTVQYVGPLSVVDAALADHAEAVVREAVSNAVRHANAATLTIAVKVEDDLGIEVVDDGQGIPDEITGSGLTNLAKRAHEVGGVFTIESRPTGGTALRWSAPLP